VLRIIHQDFDIRADTMMIVAAIGVAVNIMWVQFTFQESNRIIVLAIRCPNNWWNSVGAL
jgi:hypothetical protein